jgi:hypothetical protein
VTALLLAAALAAAPGCPAALVEAAALPDGAALARAAPAIVERLAVSGAGGSITALEAAAAEAPAAPGRFRAALARHCTLAALPASAGASEADRAALRAILAGPEFHRARSDPRALRELLLGLWGRLLELLGTAEAGRYAGVGRALFLGAAAIAALLGLGALRRRRARRRVGVGVEPRAVGAAGDDPGAAAERAEAALARGDAREAVREALLCAIAALEREGAIPRGRALTNGELVEAVRGWSGDLAFLATLFDRAIYGVRAIPLPDARAAVGLARAIAVSAGRSTR